MGADNVANTESQGMGAEDFPFFTNEPAIPSVYFSVGGTNLEELAAANDGTGPDIASHHSPLFKIDPEPAVTSGVRATVLALMELMPAN